MYERDSKVQMEAVHDVLDSKMNENPVEDLKHGIALLMRDFRRTTEESS